MITGHTIRQRTLGGLLGLAAILSVSGCDLQKNVLYYPDHHMPSAEQRAADRLQFWPNAEGTYRGFLGASPPAPQKGTIVVLHGNAGTAADRTFYISALTPLGYRVLLAEYPGYGRRQGDPGEAVLVKDALETLRLARELHGRPLYLLGESLGCGVAAAAAKQAGSGIDGIILVTPWDSLLSVAKEKFPWLPVRLLLSDTYDSVENLRTFDGPLAVIGAERDEVIPIGHARTLFNALPAKKRMWVAPGAGHNDWPLSVDRSLWQEVTGFLRSHDATSRNNTSKE